MSKLETNTIDTISGSNTLTLGGTNLSTVNMASGVSPGTGMGKVLQTKYFQTGATLTATNTSFADLGSFSVTITPSSTSSIILLSANFGSALGGSGNNSTMFRFTRNGTAVAVGDQEGSNRPRVSFRTSSVTKLINGDDNHAIGLTFSAIDTPSSTSALTYKIQNWNEGGTFYLNRNVTFDDTVANYSGVSFSSFIVQELAG